MATKEKLALSCWPAADSRFTGYQFAHGVGGKLTQLEFGGVLGVSDTRAVGPETVFDLASVTKLYTATIASMLHDAGTIDLSAPISSWSSVTGVLGELSTTELLTHTSGLPPVWEEQLGRAETIASLLGLNPEASQTGQLVYSCTGYSLFAVALESFLGKRFDEIVQELLLTPLSLRNTHYNPDPKAVSVAVAKEPKEQIAEATVHDPRARAMAGVSGNAGLFADCKDVFSFMSEVATGNAGVVSDGVRRQLFTPLVRGEWQQSIGFRFNDAERLGEMAHYFSHTGFTGTLVMIEPESAHVAVLLTNRLQRNSTREQMAQVYRQFAESIGGAA